MASSIDPTLISRLQRQFRASTGPRRRRGPPNKNVIARNLLRGAVSAPRQVAGQPSGVVSGLGETINILEGVASSTEAGPFFREEAINLIASFKRRATPRAAAVGRSRKAQKDTLALNRLVQSGRRKTRGAAVALPIISDERRGLSLR